MTRSLATQPVLHANAVVDVTSAILPAVALMVMPPLASGVGSAGAAALLPSASCTRKNRPGAIVPVSAVTCHDDPAADAYCTLQPVTSTGALPRFCNSMKSFRSGAPELPPPP